MTEETEIVQQEMVQLGTLQVAPEAVIERATRISKALADVIEDRKLYKKIGNKRHVLVEGWNLLGTMVGISPKERSVEKHEDDGVIEYESYVDLVRNNDGLVIGGASAICRTSENNWSDKPLYAVRSMSVTRATGKAFRLKLSWIMELAGFSPTPAEEMDFVGDGAGDVTPKKKSEKGNGKRPLAPEYLRKSLAMKAGGSYADQHASTEQLGLAMGMLEACFAGDSASEEKRRSVLVYLFDTDSGKNLTNGEILSLLDWLKPTKDSGNAYTPDSMAAKEAQAVIVERMKELGQDELPI